MFSDDEIPFDSIFGSGWAFYKCSGAPPFPAPGADLGEWIAGFAAAMAEYGDGCHSSVEQALAGYGVQGDLLRALLAAAERVRAAGEWRRWPLVPVRAAHAYRPEDARRLLIV